MGMPWELRSKHGLKKGNKEFLDEEARMIFSLFLKL